MKRLLSTIVTILLLVVLLTSCSQDSNGTDSSQAAYKIAVAAPFTGEYAEYGRGFSAAVQIAVDEWNEKGGLLGHKIEMVTYDDKNSPEEGAAIAQKIVGVSEIVGVIGHFASGVSMSAGPTYNENQYVLIAPSAAHTDYSGMGEYLFRNNALVEMENNAQLACLTKVAGADAKIGVIQIKNDWGVSAQAAFEKLTAKDGPWSELNIVDYQEFIEGTVDYGPIVTSFQNKGVEAVLCLCFYPQVAPFATQMKKVNPDVYLSCCTSTYNPEMIKLGGDAVEGAVMPIVFAPDSDDPIVKNFVKKYKEATGDAPGGLYAQAYDSANILFQAITDTGSIDRPSIKDAIFAVELDGVTGYTTFNEIGDAQKSFMMAKVENGEFVLMGQIDLK